VEYAPGTHYWDEPYILYWMEVNIYNKKRRPSKSLLDGHYHFLAMSSFTEIVLYTHLQQLGKVKGDKNPQEHKEKNEWKM